jgi:hypothetical protein
VTGIETPHLDQLARIVLQGVSSGKAVEIDGLGTFYPDSQKICRFEPRCGPQVFIAYGKEDQPLTEQLYDALQDAGFSPWMDARKLLPGQNWPRAIENAIETSDFFIACFSESSVRKKGGFQAEIRYALDCARHVPLDEIFVIPVRLNTCNVPRAIQREYQYLDLFPNWDAGVRRLLRSMRKEWARRKPAGGDCR